MPLWQSILKKPESGIRITVKCPAPSPVISNRVLALFPIRQEISSPNHFVQLHPKICCLRHRQIGNNTPWFRDPTRIFTSWMLAFRKKANNPRAQCRHGRQRCVGPLPSAGAPFPPVALCTASANIIVKPGSSGPSFFAAFNLASATFFGKLWTCCSLSSASVFVPRTKICQRNELFRHCFSILFRPALTSWLFRLARGGFKVL